MINILSFLTGLIPLVQAIDPKNIQVQIMDYGDHLIIKISGSPENMEIMREIIKNIDRKIGEGNEE